MIEGREGAIDPVGEINEIRDKEDIYGNLKIGEKRKVLELLQQVPVDACQHVDRQNEIVKVDRLELIDSIFLLKEDECAEQKSDKDNPAYHQPLYTIIMFLS